MHSITPPTHMDDIPAPIISFQESINDFPATLQWSSCENYLAIASTTGQVSVFDVQNKVKIKTWQAHQQGLHDLKWHPDKAIFVTSGQDGKACCWQLKADNSIHLLWEFNANHSWVEHIDWHTDGKRLAVASGKMIEILDENGLLKEIHAHERSTIAAIAWHPKLSQLAVTGYGQIEIWHPENNNLQKLQWHGSLINCSWSPEGKIIVSGSMENTVHTWRVKTGKDSVMRGFQSKPKYLSWRRDGNWLAIADKTIITCWPFDGKGPEGRSPAELQFHPENISALSFSHKSNWLASGCKAGLLAFWPSVDNNIPQYKVQLQSAIECIHWASNKLAVASRDGKLMVLALENQR